MKITVVFRDDVEHVYEEARIATISNDKTVVIRYSNLSKTDYIPMIAVRYITEEKDA